MPVVPCSYIEIVNNLVQISIQIAGEFIDKASINLVSMCRSDDENNEIYPEDYKSDVKNYISVASVTINGTWQKWYGFNSSLGVVFIISVHAGEVLDFKVKCKHFFECRVRCKWDENSDECEAGKVSENECSINHEKSTGKYRKGP